MVSTLGTIHWVLLIFARRKKIFFRQCDNLIFNPFLLEGRGFLRIAKGDSIGNCLGPCLSWIGFFVLSDLDQSPFSRVTTWDLFRNKELKLDRFAELGHTDSLV